MTHDLAILGAGAAGLFAAIRAAERGKKVLLLEKNRKPGVKILMSGGTRCNVTHDGPPDEVARAFGKKGGRFLGPSLRALPPERVMHWFEKENVRLKTEPPHGKVFPRSDRATDVLHALVSAARRAGVVLRTECPVASVRTTDGGAFAIKPQDGEEITVPRVFVAMGGQSYPKAGTCGDGYAIARALGHTVVTPRPALVPINLATPLPELSGVTLEDAKVGIGVRGGKVLAAKRGELLFTHKGLSGPTALDVSGELTARTSGVVRDVDSSQLEVVLDLIPDVDHERITAELQQGRGGRYALAALHDLGLPRSVAKALFQLVKLPEGKLVQELRREERAVLIRTLKDLRIAPAGTLGFDKAEVTAGGVALDEVDAGSLESKRVKRLHFIGEVLDVDGPVGGYNFQAAWSTGWAAGSVA